MRAYLVAAGNNDAERINSFWWWEPSVDGSCTAWSSAFVFMECQNHGTRKL